MKRQILPNAKGRLKRAWHLVALATWGTSLVAVGPAFGEEFIVKMKPGLHKSLNLSAISLTRQHQVAVLDTHDAGQLIKIDIEGNQKNSLIAQVIRIMKRPDVEYIVPNARMQAFGTPNDPRFSEQWSHAKVNSAKAWDTGVGSHKTVVAVIDTGVDYQHEDLQDNIWTNPKEIAGNGVDDDNNGLVDDVHGWDFHSNDADPDDETSDKNPGHGTHCAGIVGAVGDNGTGLSGMSQKVSIMPVRFLGADGGGDLFNGAKAIDYAVNNGAQIISASWGAAVPESGAKPIIEAIERANQKGVIFIAAAANDGTDNDSRAVFPANTNLPNMISVAASQSDDTKPKWSNFGFAKVHLASPGHEILSTLPENKYGKLSGTSMATPMVSGLAALLLSETNEKMDGMTLRSLMQTTGAKVEIETACSCRIDAHAAINFLKDKKMMVVPAALSLVPGTTAQFGAWSAKAPLTFKSSSTDVATIDDKGVLSAKALGETTVTVTGADQQSASSLKIRVAEQKEQASSCPLGDELLCLASCAFLPELPWCKQ